MFHFQTSPSFYSIFSNLIIGKILVISQALVINQAVLKHVLMELSFTEGFYDLHRKYMLQNYLAKKPG